MWLEYLFIIDVTLEGRWCARTVARVYLGGKGGSIGVFGGAKNRMWWPREIRLEEKNLGAFRFRLAVVDCGGVVGVVEGVAGVVGALVGRNGWYWMLERYW